MKGSSSNDDSISAVDNAPRPVNNQEEPIKLKGRQVPVDPHPMSGVDIYVDAPSMPLLNQPSAERNDNQLDDTMNSFQSEGSSHFSIEDDQVTAQLITEMERASQQSAKPNETTETQAAPNKRKRTTNSQNVNKKTKRAPDSSDSQTAAEVPRTGETVVDCVMIDVREASHTRPVLPQQIKRELSESPSVYTSIQAAEETPVTQERPANLLRNSEASQAPSQENDTPMTAKRAAGRPRGSRNNQVKVEEAEKEQASALRKSTRVSERLSGFTISSPHMSPASSQVSSKGGQWLAFGKTPRRGMFKWLQRSSAESENIGTHLNSSSTAFSANEGHADDVSEQPRVQDYERLDVLPAYHQPEHHTTTQEEDREVVANQSDVEPQPEASGVVETEGDIPTGPGILRSFQSMLDKIKRVTFGPEEERAMVGILFECVKEVHEAGRRHTSM